MMHLGYDRLLMGSPLRRSGVVIPKAATLEHVRENRAALDIRLTDQDLAELDRAFPPPKRLRPLELL
jgi:diketogulonate reductase-like aldo/keto reductase